MKVVNLKLVSTLHFLAPISKKHIKGRKTNFIILLCGLLDSFTMDYRYLILAILIVILAYYFKFKPTTKGKGPPILRGIPVLGYLPFLRKDSYRQFLEMSKKYGNIFQVQIGPNNILILNDWKSIKEALRTQSDTFSGRPDTYFNRQLTNCKDIGTQTSTAKWKSQRRFVQSTLKTMSVTKSLEYSVLHEAEKIMGYFDKNLGQVFPLSNIFFNTAINVVWEMITGIQYAESDKQLTTLQCHISMLNQFYTAISLVHFFPILRHFSKACDTLTKVLSSQASFSKQTFNNIKERYTLGMESSNYIEVFLGQEKSEEDAELSMTEENVVSDMSALLIAGSDSTSNMLFWSVLYMVVWPDIQSRVQQELDTFLTKTETPSYKENHRFIYTNAVLLEVQRYSSLTPFSLHHLTKCDTVLCGLHIPANTMVWPNLWALHHHPELWDDPEIFRPERFIDAEGKISKPEYLIPFSLGARRCVGEDIAKLELFLIFASIMQRYTFRYPTGHPPPSLEPIPGIALTPQPFSLLIQKR